MCPVPLPIPRPIPVVWEALSRASIPSVEGPLGGCLQLFRGRPALGSLGGGRLTMEFREPCSNFVNSVTSPEALFCLSLWKQENTFQCAPKPEKEDEGGLGGFPTWSENHTIRWDRACMLFRELTTRTVCRESFRVG